jgi:hypothetical protein
MKNEVSENDTSAAAFDRRRLVADVVGMASSTLGVWFLAGLLCTIVTAILTASAIPSLLVAVIGLQMQVLDNYGKSVRNQDQKYRDFERRYHEAQRADEERDEELLGEVKHQAESVTKFGKFWNALAEGPLSEDEFARLCENAARVDLSSDHKPAWIKDWAERRVADLADLFEELVDCRVTFPAGSSDIDRYLVEHLVPETKGSIDATSVQAVDEAFWSSQAGKRYFASLCEALRRGVSVRRIFVYDDWERLAGIAHEQQRQGIDARRVKRLDILEPHKRRDFIVFRDAELVTRNGRTVQFEHARGATYRLNTEAGGDIAGCTIEVSGPHEWSEDSLELIDIFDELWDNCGESLPADQS